MLPLSPLRAADPRHWPRIRGQDVAKWPHPSGDLDACDFARFCPAEAAILAPGFDKTVFDL